MGRLNGVAQRLAADLVTADHNSRGVHQINAIESRERADETGRAGQFLSEGGNAQRDRAAHAAASSDHPKADVALLQRKTSASDTKRKPAIFKSSHGETCGTGLQPCFRRWEPGAASRGRPPRAVGRLQGRRADVSCRILFTAFAVETFRSTPTPMTLRAKSPDLAASGRRSGEFSALELPRD